MVILDEPTAALGVKEGNQVLQLIRDVRDRGLPVILISHNMPHVFEVADRIHIQRLGRRVAVITPQVAHDVRGRGDHDRRADGLSAGIGLVFEDVSNPFFAAVHRGVEDVARTRSVLTFVGSSDDPPRERELVRRGLLGRGVDGLVIAGLGRSQLPRSATSRRAWRWPSSTARQRFIDADAW